MLSNLFNALIKRSGLKAERVLMPLDSFVLCMKVLGVYAIQNTTSSREKKMIDTWQQQEVISGIRPEFVMLMHTNVDSSKNAKNLETMRESSSRFYG
jgi:hypothetical protein